MLRWPAANLDPSAPTFSLKALLRRAGLPLIRFHDLRHTFATLQLAAGTNPKIVSEVLGHKEVAITLDRYSHALPTLQTQAMARLDAILGRGDDAAERSGGYKGSNKGSPVCRRGRRRARSERGSGRKW